jgi:hypothetical protein
MKHLCQGQKCHTYETQSRVRGTKGNKVLRTRFARYDIADRQKYSWAYNWEFYFCDERCMNNWLEVHMTQLINFVGLKTKPQESPIDIVVEELEGWRGKYKQTKITPKNNLVVSQ